MQGDGRLPRCKHARVFSLFCVQPFATRIPLMRFCVPSACPVQNLRMWECLGVVVFIGASTFDIESVSGQQAMIRTSPCLGHSRQWDRHITAWCDARQAMPTIERSIAP